MCIWKYLKKIVKDKSGLCIVDVILILIILIGMLIIFKSQITEILKVIFQFFH